MNNRLRRSDVHFPYRKYAPRRRAPFMRRLRRRLRTRCAAHTHDCWLCVFVLALGLALIVLEALRI